MFALEICLSFVVAASASDNNVRARTTRRNEQRSKWRTKTSPAYKGSAKSSNKHNAETRKQTGARFLKYVIQINAKYDHSRELISCSLVISYALTPVSVRARSPPLKLRTFPLLHFHASLQLDVERFFFVRGRRKRSGALVRLFRTFRCKNCMSQWHSISYTP